MTISRQHILTHIPEPALRALLVGFPLELRMADFLEIKLGHLDRDLAYGQDRLHHADGFEMSLYLVRNRRSKPALRFLSVEKACLAIARLAAPSCATELAPGSQQFLDIRSWLHFCLEEHRVLRR